MGAVDTLLANISKHGGLAKPNRFLVQIALPPSRQFAEQFQRLTSQEDIGPPEQGFGTQTVFAIDQRTVSLFCDSVSMPGRTVNNEQVRHFQDPYKLPTSVTYGESAMTFLCDKDLKVRTFFEIWQDTIRDRETGMFNFYEEYVSDIAIFQLDDQDVAVYGCRLEDCYVGDLGAIEYSNASTGVVRQPITMQFRRWSNIALDSQPSTSANQAGNEVPNRAPTRRTTFNLGVKIKL